MRLPRLLASSLIAFVIGCNVSVDRGRSQPEGGAVGVDQAAPGGEPADLAVTRNRDAACAKVSAQATLGKKPVDIVIVIDNSGSMTTRILGVQNNINMNFAQILGQSGLDYRVIMVSRHGNALLNQSICISAPLSGTNCNPIPNQPANTQNFFHYSVEISSHNSLSQILDTYNKPDEFNLAPGGWSAWLRPNATRVFLEITDDDADRQAGPFETQLFALQPARFGDAMSRGYVFHGIIGIQENNPPTKPYGPNDPIVNKKCLGALFIPVPATGVDYQQLAILSGGLRFPICQDMAYDAVFKTIAGGVVAGAKVACDFAVPAAPMGEQIDLDTVVVEYTPSGGGARKDFAQVKDAMGCAADSFYIDKASQRIVLCPAACGAVQADGKASVDVLFDCVAPLM